MSARQIALQYVDTRIGNHRDTLPDLDMAGQGPTTATQWFHYIVVYVREGTDHAEDFKMDIHKSIGGQDKVFCPCLGDCNPLIVSGCRKAEARTCMSPGCQGREKFRCSSVRCTTRICQRCFNNYVDAGPGRVDLAPPISSSTDPSRPDQELSDDGNLGDDEESQQSGDNNESSQSSDSEDDEDDEKSQMSEDDDESSQSSDSLSEPFELVLSEDENMDDALEGDDGDDGDFADQNMDDDLDEFEPGHRQLEFGRHFEEESEDESEHSGLHGELGFDEQPEEFDSDYEDQLRDDASYDEGDGSNSEPRSQANEDARISKSSDQSEDDDLNPEGTSNADQRISDHPRGGDLESGSQSDSSSREGSSISGGEEDSDESNRGCPLPKSAGIRRSASVNRNEDVNRALENFHTCTPCNPMDEVVCDLDSDGEDRVVNNLDVPCTDAGDKSFDFLRREQGNDNSPSRACGPMYVILNMFGALNSKRNKRITGTQTQQNLVQRMVSRMRGHTVSLLYLAGGLMPRHFFLNARHDKLATCGVLPVSCYRSGQHPDGFASHLQTARNQMTLACSTCQYDQNLHFLLYSVIANQASSQLDSRQISQRGFRVCHASPSGITAAQGDESNLTECADSRQCVMNLAAAAVHEEMDIFLTLTLNQAEHPGVRHLHAWKESMEWTKEFRGYDDLTSIEKKEVKQSFDMAYLCVVNRCWLEVKREFIKFITYRCEKMWGRGAVIVFMRDEFQESTGQLHLVRVSSAFIRLL